VAKKLKTTEEMIGSAEMEKFIKPEVEVVTFEKDVVTSSTCITDGYCRGYCAENYCTSVCENKCNYVVCDVYN